MTPEPAAAATDSPARLPLDAPAAGPLAVLGWGTFLGMSWTWCIGMFLPVLLVREVGFWGWVIFTVPNVLGAGAMGWVLRDAERSRRVVADHPAACGAFSAVTILFQVTFAGWIVAALVGYYGAVMLLGATALTVLASRWGGQRGRAEGRHEATSARGAVPAGDDGFVLLPRGGAVLLAIVVFAASATAFVLAITNDGSAPAAGFPPITAPRGEDDVIRLVSLAPVCVLGFLLCPYLDLTFHRARQATAPRAGAAAFWFGFGGPFLLMLVFTLWYAQLLVRVAGGAGAAHVPPALRWVIATHMAVQLGYTIGVHWTALGLSPPFRDAGRTAGGLLGFAAGLVPPAVGLFAGHLAHTGLSRGEIVYRLFLAFYGLVFPAYAWACMVPLGRGGAPGPSRPAMRAFVIAVIVAGPMYWMGFIERQWVWLLPAVGVVLASRLLVRRGTSKA